MSQYQEFDRLKKEVLNKLLSIQDGSRMKDYSDNMLENVTNYDTFQEALSLMNEAADLVTTLADYES